MHIMSDQCDNIFEKDDIINISDDLDWGNEGYNDQFSGCDTHYGSSQIHLSNEKVGLTLISNDSDTSSNQQYEKNNSKYDWSSLSIGKQNQYKMKT